MTDLKLAATAWCDSYVDAFNAYDAEGVSAHWTFPALIIQSGRTLAFQDAGAFTRNTSMLLGFYEAQGVARAIREVVDVFQMDAETLSMRVEDRMVDKAGNRIVGWTAAYVLQQVDGDWRAAVALADGETAAWAAAGTPLGKR